MWVFWGWDKMCKICVCTFLKLLKCEKYISQKVGQISLFITTYFLQEKLKDCILNIVVVTRRCSVEKVAKFTGKRLWQSLFLIKSGHFFPVFEKEQGRPHPPPSFSYVSVVIRECRIAFSLTKWLSVRLRTKWFWIRVQLQSLHLQISCLLQARSSLTFRQL